MPGDTPRVCPQARPRSGGPIEDAAKDGGFMGFGAEQVSAGEQQMLDQVRAVLGVT